MTSARDAIMKRLAAGLAGRDDAAARQAVAARVAARQANLVPERAAVTGRERIRAFIAMAEEVSATVARVGSLAGVPGAVAEYLRQNNLPARGAIAPHPTLDAMPWEGRPMLQFRRDRAQPFDEVGIALAFAGVAETGTLLLHSGAETPTTINFLPETHIVVLRARDIVGGYEDAFARLRQAHAAALAEGRLEKKTSLPRTVNFVTGPSRSADIEQTLQLGAHGPRRLHIVLVDDEAPAADPRR
jgi:L-lactate dehydrogenase complex protein LldG